MTVGHNEKDNFDAKIDAVMQEATTHGVATVLWLTYQNVIRPQAYPGNNAAVRAAAARWPQLRSRRLGRLQRGQDVVVQRG